MSTVKLQLGVAICIAVVVNRAPHSAKELERGRRPIVQLVRHNTMTLWTNTKGVLKTSSLHIKTPHQRPEPSIIGDSMGHGFDATNMVFNH